MAKSARYHLDAHLLRSIGERFKRPEQALMEFIDNAWDADAREVTISLPDPLSDEPIEIADNGHGMHPSDIEPLFFTVGVDRRASGGSRTSSNRTLKGSNGTGRFAGFAVARRLMVQTTAAGLTSYFEISAEPDGLRTGTPIDLREFPIDTRSENLPDGTTVRLRDLVAGRPYPSREALAEQVMYVYCARPDFRVVIDGRPVSGADLPVVPQVRIVDMADGVTATIRMWNLGSDQRTLARSEIVIRSGGVDLPLSKPVTLGSNLDIPESIRRRTWIEVDLTTATGEPPIDSVNFLEGQPVIQSLLQSIQHSATQFASEIARLNRKTDEHDFTNEYESEIAQLPPTRQELARAALMRVFQKFFDNPIELKKKVAEVVLQAFARDEYAAILEEIFDAEPGDVFGIARLLEQWGLFEVKGLLERADRRLQFLASFDRLVGDPKTKELEGVHKSLRDNLWLLGDSYELLTSNQTLRSVAQKLGGGKYHGERSQERPDLILGGQHDRLVLVELKRPSERVDHSNIGQALKYQGELRKQFTTSRISVVVIAGSKDPTLDEAMYNNQQVLVTTFVDVLNLARQRLQWLVNHLSDY